MFIRFGGDAGLSSVHRSLSHRVAERPPSRQTPAQVAVPILLTYTRRVILYYGWLVITLPERNHEWWSEY